MRKIVLFLCLALFILGNITVVRAIDIDIIPGVSCQLDKWCLTIKKGDISLQHFATRDYIIISLGGEIFTAIDFDADNVIDIIFNKGRVLSRKQKKDECKYKEIENLLLKWKEEVEYLFLVEIWKEKRGS